MITVNDPWQTQRDVGEGDAASTCGSSRFGFPLYGPRDGGATLMIDHQYQVTLAGGLYDLTGVWLLSADLLLAVIEGRGYLVSTNRGLECEEMSIFPVRGVHVLTEERQVLLWSFSDMVLVSDRGVRNEMRDVVQDDLAPVIDYPIVTVTGWTLGEEVVVRCNLEDLGH